MIQTKLQNYIFFKEDKMHAVRVYKYIRGETMNNIIVNSEISTDFGSYVGNLTSILKVFFFFL